MNDLIIMIVEAFSIFGTGALANEFIIKFLVKSEKGENVKEKNKLITIALCTIILFAISLLNLIVNCNFLNSKEIKEYIIYICLFQLFSIILYCWICKGGKYKNIKIDKKIIKYIVLTIILFTIFLLCTIVNIIIYVQQ
ncbi:MAG: hypothetical protein ACLRRH_06230 [Clostridium sp.]